MSTNQMACKLLLAAALTQIVAATATADSQGPEDSLPADVLVSDMRLGPFYVRPFIEISEFGYDSNVFNATEAKSDFTALISPGLRLALPFGDNVLSLRQQVGYRFFRDAEASRNWTSLTRIGLDFLVGSFRVDLGEELQRTNAVYGTERVSRALRIENAFSASINSSREASGYFEGVFRHSIVRFDEKELLDDQSLSDQYDRAGISGRAGVYLDLFLPGRLALGAQTERYTFRVNGDRDATSNFVFSGLRFEPGRRISGDLLVGYRDLDTTNIADDFKGLGVDGSLVFELGAETRMTLTGRRANAYSDLSANSYSVGTWAGTRIDVPLGGRFAIGVFAKWADVAYPLSVDKKQLDGSHTYFSQGLDFTFPVADEAAFTVGFDYRRLEGNSFEYDGTAITTGLRYGL